MPRRPVIGVAPQTQMPKPGELPLCWIMGARYIDVLRSAGAIPWIVPLIPHDKLTLDEIFSRLDGVFLTGGADVDPGSYSEPKLHVCGYTDPARDAIEIMLLNHAKEMKKPVLAVCRGIQILNVCYGGTLYQDIPSQVPAAIKHDYFPKADNTPKRDFLSHEITVTSDSRLRSILVDGVVPVNSMHHQAIKDLAPGLRPNAYAPDGIIEGVEGTNGQYLMAVQWHPEELVDSQPGMKRLFSSFIDAASKA
jgi:putative glutamine amidotransferase